MLSNVYKEQLFELLAELSRQEIDFVVCGGVACVLQGVERATYDLDIAIALDTENIRKLIVTATSFSLKPRIPEPVENLIDKKRREFWIREKGARVYTFVSESSPLQMDVFLTELILYEKLKTKADILDIEGTQLAVCSKKHLLDLKKMIEPLRDKDIQDIKELESLISEET